MKLRIKLVCISATVFMLSCAFACWVRSDMPDYPQDRHYVYEGNDYRISSHREMDEAILDEMSQSITIWNEEQIEIGQIFLPELQPPESVPEGYYFESLMITKYLSGRWEYIFTYRDILGRIIFKKEKPAGE